jgi:hypothetical protein
MSTQAVETVTVWRLEDSARNGPYVRTDWTGRAALTSAHEYRNPPSLPAGYRSACASRSALAAWFGPFLPALVAAGFRMVKVTLPASEVIKGSREVSYRAAAVISARPARWHTARYALQSPGLPPESHVPDHARIAQLERDLGMLPQPVYSSRAVGRTAYLTDVRSARGYVTA